MKGGKVQALLAALSGPEREALERHLTGGTGALWLAETLTKNGHPVGQTSIKEWRRNQRG